jgi:hypothetical protein
MRVTLETGGGTTGLRRTAELDTDELTPAQTAGALWALDGMAPAGRLAPGPQQRYRLTIYRPTGPQVVDLEEPDIPSAVRPLLTELLKRARPRR